MKLSENNYSLIPEEQAYSVYTMGAKNTLQLEHDSRGWLLRLPDPTLWLVDRQECSQDERYQRGTRSHHQLYTVFM